MPETISSQVLFRGIICLSSMYLREFHDLRTLKLNGDKGEYPSQLSIVPARFGLEQIGQKVSALISAYDAHGT